MTKYITHTAFESRKVTPHRAKKYNGSEDLHYLVQQYLVQLKYDGVGGVLVFDPDNYGPRPYLMTRTGEVIYNLEHIKDAFVELPFGMLVDTLVAPDATDGATVEWPGQRKAGVYFGEFWHNEFAATTVAGLMNASAPEKLAAGAEDRKKIQLVVNDYVTLDEWYNGASEVGFEERIRRIQWLNAVMSPDECKAHGITNVPPIWFCGHEGMVCDQAAVSLDDLAKEAKAAGRYDGVILRDPLGKWKQSGRNEAIIKVKPTITVDVQVIGYEVGKGKYSHCIGAILYEHGGKVGKCSGMTDAQRGVDFTATGHVHIEDFYRCNWAGKVIELEAMEVSKHGLLREPRFKGIREGVNASTAE